MKKIAAIMAVVMFGAVGLVGCMPTSEDGKRNAAEIAACKADPKKQGCPDPKPGD